VTLDQDVDFLQSIPLFADFPAEQLRLIAFSAEPLQLPEGTTLFREGAEADGGYVVVSGAVELSANRHDGHQDVAIAGPGALIGELALLCPTTRPVTATTIEPSELMTVSRRLLRRVLEEYPDMAERLRMSLSERLQKMNMELGQTRERLLAIDGPEPEQEAD
jgi:CRP-like cAMP-binding protein